jgi:hypothetical protein
VGYIPEDVEWYIADLLIEISVEGDPRRVLHTNLTLVRADSPEQAYDGAIKLGALQEGSWENPDGKRVTLRFRGLGSLNVVHGKVEHGTELIYDEEELSEQEIIARVAKREELGVFRPIPDRDPSRLNYGSRDIENKLRDQFPDLFDADGNRI